MQVLLHLRLLQIQMQESLLWPTVCKHEENVVSLWKLLLVELNCILFFRYARVNIFHNRSSYCTLDLEACVLLGYRSTEQSSFLSLSLFLSETWTLICVKVVLAGYSVVIKSLDLKQLTKYMGILYVFSL